MRAAAKPSLYRLRHRTTRLRARWSSKPMSRVNGSSVMRAAHGPGCRESDPRTADAAEGTTTAERTPQPDAGNAASGADADRLWNDLSRCLHSGCLRRPDLTFDLTTYSSTHAASGHCVATGQRTLGGLSSLGRTDAYRCLHCACTVLALCAWRLSSGTIRLDPGGCPQCSRAAGSRHAIAVAPFY